MAFKQSIGLLIVLVLSAPVAGAMTEAQEYNMRMIENEQSAPRQYLPPNPVTTSEERSVPYSNYRQPVAHNYTRSYSGNAYIPMGAPPASMVYQGTPNAPVSPLFKMFAGMMHPPAAPPGGEGTVAPSAVTGAYGGTPGLAPTGANVPVEQGGSNPFNLSPFGMLHYMWDDTTYTSPTNPVALYQVQSDLQIAKQQSQLAQSAAARAKYATDPKARQTAAQQAQYYARQSQLAAERARSESEAGSLDPAQLATSAANDANEAYAAAKKANTYASGSF